MDELVREGNLNATITETNSTKINTIVLMFSQFPGEIFPAVDPAHKIMSIVTLNCKIVSTAGFFQTSVC